jgi:hypothetical protein
MYRRAKYIEPDKVFVCWKSPTESESESHTVRLWIRNTDGRKCRRVVAGLKALGVIHDGHGKYKRDLVCREHHYYTYWELTLEGVTDDELLKTALQEQYRLMQDTQVEWVTAYRFLNMKVWHRRER